MADYDAAMDGGAASGNGYGRDRSPVDSRRERDEEYDRNGGDADVPPPRGGGDDDYRGSSRRDDRERSPRRRPPPPPPGRGEAPPSNVLGCFGLSIRTKDIDLEEEFSRYGRVEKATIVYDQRSERSRGFGFVTMASQEEAEKCIEKLNGIELHGRNIRVAYSMTTKPHQSTPGEYMGFKTNPPRFGDRERYPPRDRYDDRRDRDRGYGGGYRRDDRYDDRRDRDRGYDRGYSRRDDRYDDRRDDRYDDRRGGSSRRDDSPRRRSPRDYDRPAVPEL